MSSSVGKSARPPTVSRRFIMSREIFIALSFAHFQLSWGTILASVIQQSVAVSPFVWTCLVPRLRRLQTSSRCSRLNGNQSAKWWADGGDFKWTVWISLWSLSGGIFFTHFGWFALIFEVFVIAQELHLRATWTMNNKITSYGRVGLNQLV